MNKVVVITTAVLCFLCAHIASGQSMVRMYRSIYSIAGYYGSGNSTATIDQGAGSQLGGTSDSDVLRFSTRDGYFLYRNLALGGEFSWEHQSSSYQPDPNPINYRSESRDRRLFVGPWVRWYVPTSVRWYAALEASAGYVHTLGEKEESTSSYILPKTTTSANGIGVNVGAGMGYFLSRGIALDITARYGAGWLNGKYRTPGNADLDVELDYGEVSFLLGVQLLL